jgi:hypothetical protein
MAQIFYIDSNDINLPTGVYDSDSECAACIYASNNAFRKVFMLGSRVGTRINGSGTLYCFTSSYFYDGQVNSAWFFAANFASAYAIFALNGFTPLTLTPYQQGVIYRGTITQGELCVCPG